MAEALSPAAVDLLADLAHVPQSTGYDHRIRELDEHKPRLIEWVPGWGYGPTEAGRALLAARLANALISA